MSIHPSTRVDLYEPDWPADRPEASEYQDLGPLPPAEQASRRSHGAWWMSKGSPTSTPRSEA